MCWFAVPSVLGTVLFVGTIPIATDVAFKYWIFKGGCADVMRV